MADKRLTQAEIGRALGISKQAVSQLKAKGMPVESIEAAARWRATNIDLGRAKGARVVLAHSDLDEEDRQPPLPSFAGGDLEDDPEHQSAQLDGAADASDNAAYRQARAEREQVRLERERLALEQLKGKLIDADEAIRMSFTAFRMLRDAVLNVPARIKDEVAAEADPFHVEQRIDAELTAALGSFDPAKVLVDEDDEDEA